MYKSEQTPFCAELSMRTTPETKQSAGTTGGHLKYRHGSLFLAVALSPPRPLLPTKSLPTLGSPMGVRSTCRLCLMLRALPGVSVYRNSNLRALKEGRFPGAFHPCIPDSGFANDSKIADLDTLLISGMVSNGRRAGLLDLHFNHADLWGRDGGSRWPNHPRWGWDGGNDGAPSAVAVPEPRSLTLLLFGLAGLGLFVYRRNPLKNAI